MIMFVVVFAPAWSAFQVVIIISSSIISAETYGTISGNYRNSSLYFNSRLNKNNNFVTNIADILVAIFWGFVSFGILIIYNFLFNINDMILDNWIWNTPYKPGVFSLFLLNAKEFSFLIYSIFESLIIVTSIGFFVFRVFNSTKVYYIIILNIIVLEVIFGGMFNSYFDSYKSISGDYNVPSFWLNGEVNIFPNYFYIPSLFFPLYAPSQHLSFLIFRINYYPAEIHNTHFFIWLTKDNIAPIGDKSVFIECFTWNVLWLLPALYSGTFFLIGIIFSKKNN